MNGERERQRKRIERRILFLCAVAFVIAGWFAVHDDSSPPEQNPYGPIAPGSTVP